jgi:hypothetical protein
MCASSIVLGVMHQSRKINSALDPPAISTIFQSSRTKDPIPTFSILFPFLGPRIKRLKLCIGESRPLTANLTFLYLIRVKLILVSYIDF